MMTAHRVALLTLASLFVCAPFVSAQVDNAFALGGNFTARAAGSSLAEGRDTFGIQWRFGHTKGGWGWQFAFNWFDMQVQQPIGGRLTDFGELHVRPFMAGYGYGWIVGRAQITATFLGGYAFTSFQLDPQANDLYRDGLGDQSVRTDVSNTFAAKPEVKMWYDITEKLGLNATAGYLIARPQVTVATSLGKDSRPIRADMFVVRVGLVYSIF